jgi:fatty-acyl-CoA synthase
MSTDLLWPRYDSPSDLAEIEAVPLADRGLPATTYDVLVRAATLWPARTALNVLPDAERWQQPSSRTFADLLDDVHRYANVLHSLGVRRTDAVALLSPNCDELITATLAAQLAGIAAPLNGGLSAEHIAQLLQRSGARVLVAAGPEFASTAQAIVQELLSRGLLDTVLLLRPTGATGPAPEISASAGVAVGYFSASAARHTAEGFSGEAPVAEDIAAIFHTGGTTGTPKLAAHQHANEVTDAWMIAANNTLDEDSVVFAALPLFHVNALVVTLLAPLLRGQQVVWAGPLGYRDLPLFGVFWKLVERYRVAAMSAVPTVYATLAQCPVDADLGSFRIAMVGASPLPPAVRKSFEQHTGVPLIEGYGLTEATCASTRNFPGTPRPGSVGQRMPYQRLKTVAVRADGSWQDLPSGSIGVLAISGPTVFPGYVSGREDTGALRLDGLGKLVDGWLDTGDLALVDAEGFVYLAGRAKDLIIRGGHNIDPAMVEDALLSHPDVTGVGAVGRPDAHAGEVPVAYVTLTPGSSADAVSLRDWAAANVPEPAAAPKQVVILDALPLTDVGKPYKLPLRADAARRAVTEAVASMAGVRGVEAGHQDGAVVVSVQVEPTYDETALKDALDRYTVTWRTEPVS